jgi:hypothetical protein
MIKGLKWFARNFGKPGVIPPDDASRMWMELFRTDPVKVLDCVSWWKAHQDQWRSKKGLNGSTPKVPEKREAKPIVWHAQAEPLCAKVVLIPIAELHEQIVPDRSKPWGRTLPLDVAVIRCAWDEARKGLLLALESSAFPLVAAGAKVPEMEPPPKRQ